MTQSSYQPRSFQRPSIRRLSVASTIVALIVYWLVWSGMPHAVDELSALSVAESIWAGDGVTVNQMEWDQARTPPQNSAGLDGNLYSKKGLGVSLAALPLWAAGVSWLGGGAVRLALLTGPLLAAMAVGVMVWTAQRLGYRNRTALLAGGALGFCTLLFPYARTLFSESIAAPSLMVALGMLMVWRTQGSVNRGLLLLAGSALGVVVLVKSSNGVIAPFFLLYIAWNVFAAETQSVQRQAERKADSGAPARVAHRGKPWVDGEEGSLSGNEHPGAERKADGRVRWTRLFWALLWFSLPLAVAVAVTFLYNWMRFGTLISFPLEPFEQFTTPLLTGVAGLLLSPGKGLLWYLPLALLSIGGALWVLLKPQPAGIQRSDVLLALGTIVATVALYAAWYDWPGGRAWGPRMIAWLTPAFVILALPLLATALDRTRPLALRAVVWGVLTVSGLAQVPGVLVNFEQQEALDMAAGVSFETLLWQANRSPLLTYWRAIVLPTSEPTIEPLLLQGEIWRAAPFGLLLFAALIAVTIWLLYRHLRHRNLGAIWTALATAMAAGIVLASATGSDLRWRDQSANPADNVALVAFLDENATPDDLLLFDLQRERQVQSRAWWRQNTLPAGSTFVGWLRRTPEEIAARTLGDADAFALLDAQVGAHSRTWLVLQETPELDPASTTETHLNTLYFRGGDTWLGAQRIVPYYRWLLDPAPAAQGESASFGDLDPALEMWSLYGNGEDGRWLLVLDWEDGLDPDLRFSVQALDHQGSVVAQVDRPPSDANGRVALEAPTGSSPVARIILKLYDPVTGDVLPAPDGEALELWADEL